MYHACIKHHLLCNFVVMEIKSIKLNSNRRQPRWTVEMSGQHRMFGLVAVSVVRRPAPPPHRPWSGSPRSQGQT